MKNIISWVVGFVVFTTNPSYAQSELMLHPDNRMIPEKEVVLVNSETTTIWFYQWRVNDWKFTKITANGQADEERTIPCVPCGDGCYEPIFIKESDDSCPVVKYQLNGGKAFKVSKTKKGCLIVRAIR